ncbi:endodeoxyribonuclease [Elasticomyces elasticus]|nr:endodeoxyribonuclease [Elasticomyces elasticus]KAK3665376.1 endodeoxyribonuclease [Elasticomyces elasticus]KAK4929649.1 endodeoxyribonuclease [Elasticomyces elasticus]KAK5761129.1 endodeoxyribonuclease [Elasticomyces elasticus]
MEDEFEDLLGSDEPSQYLSQDPLGATAGSVAFYESEDEFLDDGDDVPQLTLEPDVSTSLARDNDPGEQRKTKGARAKNGSRTKPRPSKASRVTNASKKSMSNVVTLPTSPLEKITAVFEQIAEEMVEREPEITITLNVRPRIAPQTIISDAARFEVKVRHICFPGKTAEEAWRFSKRASTSNRHVQRLIWAAVVLRILELMHEALRTGVTISKRDMYYRDPALFGSQTHVDRYVDDIAFTFNVPRSALNVTAVAKGLVVGALSICRRDGSVTNAAVDRDGILIPSLKDILSVDLQAVKWILVIEKEASFRSIAASSFWDKGVASEGVLITGKGYPDIATRAFLRYLCTPSPHNGFASPPCYALVDFDPDGLAIMSVYKHGSAALAHESAELRVPQLQWLGLRSEHMLLGGDSTHASQGLLTLTARDRSKARKMLGREVEGDDIDEVELVEARRPLQVMLMLNFKAELQLLDAVPGSMTQLLDQELHASVG